MTRLIDADALGELVSHGVVHYEDIMAQPTVDAVPVIRCKDCIHRYSTCPMITVFPDGTVSFRAQDDWFCFMGEGKKNEKE